MKFKIMKNRLIGAGTFLKKRMAGRESEGWIQGTQRREGHRKKR